MELTKPQAATLLKSVKAGKNQGQCAADLGVTPGQLGMKLFLEAQLEAGIVSKAPATEASVKKLRTGGARWELIAVQTGLSVAKIKEMVGETAPVARGRKPADGATKPASKPAGREAAKPKTGVQAIASGKKGKSTAAAPARARTRAERAAKTGNPS